MGDVAPDTPVGVVEEADDGGLFVEGWQGEPYRLDTGVRESISRYTFRLDMELAGQPLALQGTQQVGARKRVRSWP